MWESQAYPFWSPPESITIRLQLLLSRLCCKLPLRCLRQGQILTLSKPGDRNFGGGSHYLPSFSEAICTESVVHLDPLGAGSNWKLEAHVLQK